MNMQNFDLQTRIERSGNSFDLFRLFAASAVIFSHSFGLVTAGGHAEADPLFRMTGGQMTFGELGVYIFFVASGFLITPSLLRSRSLGNYFVKRLLRILPGLVFVVLASIFVLGPMCTQLSGSEYFHSMATYRYLVNITMYASQPTLPGVFLDTPLQGMVNGSLWTLKFEFFCYVLLAILSITGLLGMRSVLAGAVLCVLGGVFYTGPGYGYIFYASFFLAGSALYLWRRHVPLNGMLFVGALLTLVMSAMFGYLKAGFGCVGAYVIVYLACRSDLGDRLRHRFGDYSYGIYLFGFPVQQVVVSLLGANKVWWKEFLVAYPLALALAVVSWKLVESPALRLRERLRKEATTAIPVLRADAAATVE